MGSSPRMRGTRQPPDSPMISYGIIPAYAGNTGRCFLLSRLTRDHPRVCGEHYIINPKTPGTMGSSPRMRGTPDHHHVNVEHGGIIPAYAGNTFWIGIDMYFRGDHPRVCGEHLSRHGVTQDIAGSSPRMRGTPMAPAFHPPSQGIIPAYAGNTQYPAGISQNMGDHPRVCGEHIKYAVEGATSQGSSPRMRGTHVYDDRAC